MSLQRASCCPNASQQSILGSQERTAEGVSTALRGVSSAGIKIPIRFMPLQRASCYPNSSQQSIWASQGGGGEPGRAAIRGANSRPEPCSRCCAVRFRCLEGALHKRPHEFQILASKAFGPPKGVGERLVAQQSMGPARVWK